MDRYAMLIFFHDHIDSGEANDVMAVEFDELIGNVKDFANGCRGDFVGRVLVDGEIDTEKFNQIY